MNIAEEFKKRIAEKPKCKKCAKYVQFCGLVAGPETTAPCGYCIDEKCPVEWYLKKENETIDNIIESPLKVDPKRVKEYLQEVKEAFQAQEYIEKNKLCIESNKQNIEYNKGSIEENKKRIQENRSEIDKVREEARWMYESAQARMERIIHRQILVNGLLALTNAFWILSWFKKNDN